LFSHEINLSEDDALEMWNRLEKKLDRELEKIRHRGNEVVRQLSGSFKKLLNCNSFAINT